MTIVDIHLDTNSLEVIAPYSNREVTLAEQEVLRFHVNNARSLNTNLAYKTQWSLFVSWCKEQGFIPFPADPSVVALYLTHEAEQGCKYSKLEQSVSAILAVHADNASTDNSKVMAGFRHPIIKSTLTSLKRLMVATGKNKVKKPRYFSQDEIKLMVDACPDTPQGIQDRAILLLGVNLGLRASEFCALQLEYIDIDSKGMSITIGASKGDQFGESVTLYIGRLAPHQWDFDAVKAMEAWLQNRASMVDADMEAVFTAFRKGGRTVHRIGGKSHGLNRDAITTCIQRIADRGKVAYSNQTISSHGMRHSFITQAFSKGLDAHEIAKSSRHKSLTVLAGYDQTSYKNSTVAPRLWS